MQTKVISRKFLIISAIYIWKAECGFPIDFSTCRLDCWAQPGLVSCVSDNFRAAYCCDSFDVKCMKEFQYCSLGLQNEDYKHFTCPVQDCPGNNEPMVIYHDAFNKERIDEISWQWDLEKIGFNCRVRIHADPALNGKLHVQL